MLGVCCSSKEFLIHNLNSERNDPELVCPIGTSFSDPTVTRVRN